MIDPRIRTIRFWLLSAAVCGACLVNPGWAVYFLATYSMAPLGLFMPVFATDPCPCTCCNSGTRTNQVQITFTGVVTSGTCDAGRCTFFNATHTIDHFSGAIELGDVTNCCRYFDDLAQQSCTGTVQDPMFLGFEWKMSFANTRRIMAYTVTGGSASEFSEGSNCPVDCGDAITGMTCVTNCAPASGCDFSAASADVTPI